MTDTTAERPLAAERDRMDVWLLAIAIALLGAGLGMVLDASQAYSYLTTHNSFNIFFHQVAYAVVGLVGLVIASRIDYHALRRWAPLLFFGAMALMAAVLIPHVGVNSGGAQRWINIGPITQFQPSEVAKLAIALYFAHWMAGRGRRLESFTDGFLPYAILMGVVVGLLALQKDLGTLIVTTAMMIAIYFAGGGRKRYLVTLAGAVIVVMIGLVYVERYRMQRLTTFLNPFADPSNSTLQSYQGLVALGSGGLTGVGLGHSVQKYQWLPEAQTDFIFAIIGEELGLIGCTLLIAGFVVLIVRGYRAAMRAPDRYGVALATGITTWIACQALLNMGVVTATVPITGVPLPLISYGGTALTVTLTAIGVLLNISSQGVRPRSGARTRRNDAAVDRRGGDGGTRVARARHRAGVPR
ncbi:MAG: putative lipid II flippase FtsW [Candidatus Dormiibacterota bacterium]